MPATAKIVLKWICFGVLLMLVVLVADNSRDEALSPEAQAFGTASEPGVADRENAFFAVLGFTAPPGQEPHAQGMQTAARYEAAVAKRLYSLGHSVLDLTGAQALSSDTPIQDLICGGKEDGCRQQRQQKTDYLTAVLNTHKEMSARYERLQTYPHYRNTLTATIAAPGVPFGVVASAHQLHLARVVLSFRSGDVKQALTGLEQDTRFWRMMLRDADSLIAKTVAVRQLANNAYLLAELISQNKWNGGARQEEAQKMVLPLTEQERNFGPALQREFRVARHLFTGFAKDRAFRRSVMHSADKGALASAGGDILFRLFYQPNATINYAYGDFAGKTEMLPVREFIKKLPIHGAEVESNASLIRWDFIYNPMGKYLLAANPPDFQKYKAQLYNLDGLLRLVALQLKAKREGVVPSEMADFLRNAGDAFANPYTDGMYPAREEK